MIQDTEYLIKDQHGNSYQVAGPPIEVYIQKYHHLELDMFQLLLSIYTKKYNERKSKYFKNYFESDIEYVTLSRSDIYDFLTHIDRLLATSEILNEQYLIQIAKAVEHSEKSINDLKKQNHQLRELVDHLMSEQREFLEISISEIEKMREHEQV